MNEKSWAEMKNDHFLLKKKILWHKLFMKTRTISLQKVILWLIEKWKRTAKRTGWPKKLKGIQEKAIIGKKCTF